MEIKMPIKFLGAYKLTVRSGDSVKSAMCQKLNFTRIPPDPSADGPAKSTHMITYYCFGCKRVLEGRLKENEEEKVIFEDNDREYEFAPAAGRC